MPLTGCRLTMKLSAFCRIAFPGAPLALSLLSAGKPDDAIAEFDAVLKRDPENLRARVALGETYLRAGDLDRAATQLEAAIRTSRPVTRAWNSLGEVYARRGEASRAADAWRQSLRLDPAQPEIRRRLDEAGGAGAAGGVSRRPAG